MEANYKYKEPKDFRKAHPNLFRQLYNRGELERLYLDMGWKIRQKPRGYWDIKENCIKESKKSSGKKNFRINSYGAYEASVRNGWLGEICELNGWGKYLSGNENFKQKPFGYWNIKENCIKESKTRNDKNDFRINSSGAYGASFRNGWLEEICELNGWGFRKRKPSGYWDIKENCIKEFKKSNSKKKFMINSPGAYDAAKRNGWLDEISELNGRGWNIKENCIEESKKSNSKKKFRNNSPGAYDAAKRNGWLDEICELNKWKIQIQKPYGYWDIKENCIEESKKRNGRNEFNRKSPGAYNAAKRNGWLDEIYELNNW